MALYIKQRSPDLKPSSVTEYERCAKSLREIMGDDRPIDMLTVDDAHAWRADGAVPQPVLQRYGNHPELAECASGQPSELSVRVSRLRTIDPEPAGELPKTCAVMESRPAWRRTSLRATCRRSISYERPVAYGVSKRHRRSRVLPCSLSLNCYNGRISVEFFHHVGDGDKVCIPRRAKEEVASESGAIPGDDVRLWRWS